MANKQIPEGRIINHGEYIVRTVFCKLEEEINRSIRESLSPSWNENQQTRFWQEGLAREEDSGPDNGLRERGSGNDIITDRRGGCGDPA